MMNRLASRVKHLERAVAARPALLRPPCPACGRDIVVRPRTARDEEEEDRIFGQVSAATMAEIDGLYNRARDTLPAGACSECMVDVMSRSEEGLRTCMGFNAEASAARDGTMAPAGGNAVW